MSPFGSDAAENRQEIEHVVTHQGASRHEVCANIDWQAGFRAVRNLLQVAADHDRKVQLSPRQLSVQSGEVTQRNPVLGAERNDVRAAIAGDLDEDVGIGRHPAIIGTHAEVAEDCLQEHLAVLVDASVVATRTRRPAVASVSAVEASTFFSRAEAISVSSE
jgi:hypothetical protein